MHLRHFHGDAWHMVWLTAESFIASWRLAQNRFYGGMTEDGVRDKKIAFPSFSLTTQDLPCGHQ
jgi:hypothetical protein